MEQKQMRPRPVSKRMLLVIVLALLFIMLPAVLTGLPMSKLTVTIRNGGDTAADCNLRIYGDFGSDSYESFNLYPGNTYTTTITVRPGTYQVSIHYSYNDPVYGYDYRSDYVTASVPYFQNEDVTLIIYPS